MNPFLDRESPSNRNHSPPARTLPNLHVPLGVGSSIATPRHVQPSIAENRVLTYKKTLFFNDGLHSTYVADYPRGLRGFFVLVESPLLLIATGIFAGSFGLAIDLWSVLIARFHQSAGDQRFGLFAAVALLAGSSFDPVVLMNWRPFQRIRDDDSKRLEMLVCSCAAGVSATFGSPFGGVLFGVEITSNFYLVRTLPRSFFAAVLGALFVDLVSANLC
ncbi:hypothetical protein PsorP6_005173 [Peronosclerospora sorghi]|uniref:Uncharacterized protein n=1 Tax=Peronosclerospora sorghi TaxID=230839 RepID=A0ACC0W4D0_9STRA|nr:hypothetical protein PsorP6_005173 [Peronosclerospora sorghi]